jgi:ATP-dependent RNA helicase RhlE
MNTFKGLHINTSILQALELKGYMNPTQIQKEAIPLILSGKDILGCAQTGTGKTAAFAIPILQMMQEQLQGSKAHKKIKVLILSPTRELAVQIGESFSCYGKFTNVKHTVIYGGVSQHSQTAALQKGVDVLIATPGRLKDLMDQGYIDLSFVKQFILDEADRMLDMGFIHAIKTILRNLPEKKQSLFFTATLSPEINKLAESILDNPYKIEVTPSSSAADTVTQSIYHVDRDKKKSLLIHILEDHSISTVLIFTRTKHRADAIAEYLSKSGIKSSSIHGGKSQAARQRALEDFKIKKIKALVATDVAARGIDIQKLSHVINFELPEEPETYVHRIGRTGRGGSSGYALSFCDNDERVYLKEICKIIGKQIPIVENHPFANSALSEDTQNKLSNIKKMIDSNKSSLRKRVSKRKTGFKSNKSKHVSI